MSNNWVDLDNSSMFMTIGSNFVSNHPASVAHVNAARYDTHGRGRNAGLIVVDPVQTRTARQVNAAAANLSNLNDQRKWDRYIRIRPGTNIAFVNGVMNGIFVRMYEAIANGSTDPDFGVATSFFAWHNSTSANHRANRVFINDDGTNGMVAGWPKYCDSRLKVVNDAFGDYQRETRISEAGSVGTPAVVCVAGTLSNFPVLATTVEDADCVFQKLRDHVAAYDATTVAGICGCSEADLAHIVAAWIANSRFASSDFDSATATPTAAGYRAACVMYALGATMHTSGSANTRVFSVIELLMGNMGRAGGGINALRGIHNVQGSTDMGMLFDSIPAYSSNPGVGQSYADYSNKLFGNRVLDSGAPAYATTTGAKNPYTTEGSLLGLQQKGFYNMTREWFGSKNVTDSAGIDALYSLWPKGNGYMHVEAFRRMALDTADPGRIKGFVCWGSNPALAESNQSVIRAALSNLDVLIMTELFATETVQVGRKADGWTYLFPTCAHPEEAGCVSSSGRWVQWRDRVVAPKGNSKSDLELLLRFAYALNAKGGFAHIETVWAGIPALAGLDPYDVLYGKYGYDGTSDMEAIGGDPLNPTDPAARYDADGVRIYGNEVVVEEIYKEMSSPLDAPMGVKDPVTGIGTQDVVAGTYKYRGTIWIFSGAGAASGYNYNKGNVQPALTPAINWASSNRAKSRVGMLTPGAEGVSLQYPRYSWSWLLNRRCWYNNSELAQDVPDVFVAPGYLGRLWNIGSANTLADWSTLYRSYNQMKDWPSVGTTTGKHVHAGRFPAHTEPVESPREDLVASWGQNRARNVSTNALSSDSDAGTLIYAVGNAKGYIATPIGTFADYPLVLTQGRAVEHFQGGANTRNNAWNHEAEPEPWVDISSVDALKYGIKDGDYVNIITARSATKADELGRTNVDNLFAEGGKVATALNRGWKARVGVGILANQAVAPGVVHVPWHWGERGLSKGSRVNDLSIDAWDANSTNIEWKACLCKIEKMTP